ncbi:unnamed protein product [Mycena citricolor]|uniref:Uncharacterized protein n=1 Tax=Mycena citricolor TaxID=2018698 RepID=A0AAD2HLV2_9AGAR|nr:unnamed protein product [Mycena citricolor]
MIYVPHCAANTRQTQFGPGFCVPTKHRTCYKNHTAREPHPHRLFCSYSTSTHQKPGLLPSLSLPQATQSSLSVSWHRRFAKPGTAIGGRPVMSQWTA